MLILQDHLLLFELPLIVVLNFLHGLELFDGFQIFQFEFLENFNQLSGVCEVHWIIILKILHLLDLPRLQQFAKLFLQLLDRVLF